MKPYPVSCTLSAAGGTFRALALPSSTKMEILGEVQVHASSDPPKRVDLQVGETDRELSEEAKRYRGAGTSVGVDWSHGAASRYEARLHDGVPSFGVGLALRFPEPGSAIVTIASKLGEPANWRFSYRLESDDPRDRPVVVLDPDGIHLPLAYDRKDTVDVNVRVAEVAFRQLGRANVTLAGQVGLKES